MNPELVREADRLGINASMYFLLDPEKREKCLRADIEKEKKRRRDNGGNR